MMSKNAILVATMMYMGAMQETGIIEPKEIRQEKPKQKDSKEIIPNGCKKYYFTKSGEHYTEKPKGYEIVFECIASNVKTAVKKFKKHSF